MAKTGRLPKAKATPSLRHREAKERTAATSTTTTKSAADAAVEDLGAAAAEAAHEQLGKWAWLLGVILACVKALMIPAYRSTDFEVHRNWLAITHSLPLKDWYYESTSEWTLDYPPFFAYFEFLLSQLAAMVDPGMLVVKNLNYASTATVVFQRLSVIAADFLLVYACKEWSQSRFTQLLSRSRGDSSSSSSSSVVERVSSLKHAQMIVSFLFLANFGLFLVDHVHFQYNGFLFGVLLLAVTRVFQRRHVEAAFFFAALLNLKHIYLYVAPAFFVYLLKICFSQFDGRGRVVPSSFSVVKLATIALPVVLSFALSFGPFFRHLPQVFSRLFPFKRGLCHAYWAPNVWALYNVADKAAAFALRALGVEVVAEAASMSGGLVREYSHAVLMPITPPTSTLLTLVSLAPALVNLWRCYPTPTRFVRVAILCAFSFFLFGWHVHEKAVLMMILPFTLVALETRQDKKLFFLLSAAGHFSLFPLIFTPAEAPIKVLYFAAFTFAEYRFLDANILPSSSSVDEPLLNSAEKTYVAGFALLQAYVGLGHGLLAGGQNLPFLPLMITSCYCAVGILYVWIQFYIHTTKLPL